MNRKKVLLIGGAGFIGSHLFFSGKHDYDVADRTTTGDIVQTSPRINLPRRNYDCVVFLAAEPNLRSAIQYPERAFKTLTQGLMNAIAHYPTSHFVYVSSSMVYGNWTSCTMYEEDPCAPTNIYGQLKLLGEGIVKQWHKDWSIVRPSAVYGPKDNPNRLVTLFINKIKAGETIELQGADNLFDFTHVADVVQGLELVIDSAPSGKTYNITRGEAHTLQAMTDMLYAKLDRYPNYTLEANPPNYPTRGKLGINRAYNDLGYQPEYTLDRGLDDTINKS